MAKTEVLNNDAVTVRVAEPVGDILSEASDVVEQTLDTIENTAERVVTITRNNPWILVGACVVGAAVGGFVSYKITKKKVALHYEAILDEEIDRAKKFYGRLNKREEFETPEKAVEALVPEPVTEAMKSYQGRTDRRSYDKPETIKEEPEAIVETVEIQQTNVFVQATPDPRDWDYNAEIALREEKPDEPFVVSFDEFQENPDANEQATLTYFVEDDTLVDERSQPIDNTDSTVGDDNLTRFGHGSNDKNVVYVRNDRLGMDFEIIRSEGSYAKEVLGLEPETELRHSAGRKPRRFRADE